MHTYIHTYRERERERERESREREREREERERERERYEETNQWLLDGLLCHVSRGQGRHYGMDAYAIHQHRQGTSLSLAALPARLIISIRIDETPQEIDDNIHSLQPAILALFSPSPGKTSAIT